MNRRKTRLSSFSRPISYLLTIRLLILFNPLSLSLFLSRWRESPFLKGEDYQTVGASNGIRYSDCKDEFVSRSRKVFPKHAKVKRKGTPRFRNEATFLYLKKVGTVTGKARDREAPRSIAKYNEWDFDSSTWHARVNFLR